MNAAPAKDLRPFSFASPLFIEINPGRFCPLAASRIKRTGIINCGRGDKVGRARARQGARSGNTREPHLSAL